ncbi:hypothetical protein LBMAG56_46410 [Verrucomicrobiota bacterium]|nr:hypothetical protein LBMAG56_46410 [Verrucomicrobiota bacterium]
MKPLHCIIILTVAGHAWCPLAAGEVRDLANYKPPTFAEADNFPRVPFLPAERTWERMDIHVPKGAKGDRLPCVVYLYGGGWTGKYLWDQKNTQALLDGGYVVAAPDYVLGCQQPLPMAAWDCAAAIRFLRKNAATYRIDPERIGIIGSSAGGWLAQFHATVDSSSLWGTRVWGGDKKKGGEPVTFAPAMEPHPADPEFSAQVAVLITDWGAKPLKKGDWNLNFANHRTWLGPDDPPLFTCAPMADNFIQEGPKAYREAGAIAEEAVLGKKLPSGEVVSDAKNPGDYGHTAVGAYDPPASSKNAYITKDKIGREIGYGARTLQFLDEYLRNPKASLPPEILPAGAAIAGPIPVRLRSVHPDAIIRYTLDGSEPAATSPAYAQAVTVQAGQTLKSRAFKSGRAPSAIATASFTTAPCAPPVITTTQAVYHTKVGKPFSVTMRATSAKPVTWHLSGKIEDKPAPPAGGKPVGPWLSLDPVTGVLSGTPKTPGTSVFIVAANLILDSSGNPVPCIPKHYSLPMPDGLTFLTDARSVIVVAEP